MSGMFLIFKFENTSMVIQCQQGELMDTVLDRYLSKSGIDPNDIRFFYNTKELPRQTRKTISALNIKNGGNINVISRTIQRA